VTIKRQLKPDLAADLLIPHDGLSISQTCDARTFSPLLAARATHIALVGIIIAGDEAQRLGI
jgi:hypothetical protein